MTYIHRKREKEREREIEIEIERKRKREGGGRERQRERERLPSVVIFSSLMMSFLQKMQNRYTSVAFTCFCLSSFERL